ncbi:MAG: 50S ribosomal protein L4 [Candidatus Magasanikbacteria bacterium RIFOXYC2_FULL_42_28]|uniref:Large ribosomal subunit protein uL4 n=1 Tax=Candidatus Magasanikbacteria bacterium RIFOXYC2_FULL_42_28 TaxID=1798704 RepID=A0A1F6NU95_9BACT|nr:MAG: 50S ribosomal protein L4 [Candidatus Magasanikbacteria bacterium RIFOXYC2_FULL_42_28]
MKTKLYNLVGKVVGDVELSDAIFDVKVKPTLVHAVYVAITNRARESWADTKGKGEVRGGGKKPWQQKGTGRARHGSIRSPIWKGGGVTFGPKTERNYDVKINLKEKRAATKMCFADKFRADGIFVVENFDFTEAKTRLAVELLKGLGITGKRVLFLTDGKSEVVRRVATNLPKTEIMNAVDANVVALLKAQSVIMSQAGAEAIGKILK